MSQPTTQEIANLTNLLIRLQSDYYTLKGEYSHLPSTHPLNIIYVSRGYAHGETIDRILTSLRQNPEQLRTLTTDYNTIRDTLMDLRRQLEAPPYSRRPGVEYLILREGEPDLVGQIPTFVRGFSGRTAASASATGIGSGSGSGSGSGPGSGARALRQVGGWYTVKAGKAGQAHPHADKIKISQSVGKYTPGITIGMISSFSLSYLLYFTLLNYSGYYKGLS